MIQRQVEHRGRAGHRDAGGTCTPVAVWATTHIPPPQHPAPPPTPVSVYLHRNVHESMEMNRTVQSVSVVLQVVLLLVRIATQMVTYAVILLLQCAMNKMVLQPILWKMMITMFTTASAGLQNVNIIDHIVIDLLIRVIKYHALILMVLLLILLRVIVAVQ